MQRRFMSCTILAFAALVLAAPAWAAQVQVCHVPPGNPANFHTITINDNALQAHMGHGDLAGPCSAHCSQLCDDGDKCTIDACDASEQCVATHPPVNCDDSNACTTDTCDAATGCERAPRLCLDSNLCTVDSCDPLTGQCVFPAVSCSEPGATCNPADGNCAASGPCTPDPCQNFSQCLANGSSYTCLCIDGSYTGTNCEDRNECIISDPCQNGGMCINQIPGYSCACVNGFTGQSCEIPPGQVPVDWMGY